MKEHQELLLFHEKIVSFRPTTLLFLSRQRLLHRGRRPPLLLMQTLANFLHASLWGHSLAPHHAASLGLRLFGRVVFFAAVNTNFCGSVRTLSNWFSFLAHNFAKEGEVVCFQIRWSWQILSKNFSLWHIVTRFDVVSITTISSRRDPSASWSDPWYS